MKCMGCMWRECHQDNALLTTEINDLKCLMGRIVAKGSGEVRSHRVSSKSK